MNSLNLESQPVDARKRNALLRIAIMASLLMIGFNAWHGTAPVILQLLQILLDFGQTILTAFRIYEL